MEHLELVRARNRCRFLLQELNDSTVKRDVLRAQLNKLTSAHSKGKLEELEGLRTCPESEFLSMEPRMSRISAEFLQQ